MKMLSLILITVISLSYSERGDNNMVTIRNCFSGVTYSFQNDSIAVNMRTFNEEGGYAPYVYKTRLSSLDSARFQKTLDKFLAYEWDEVFSNEEVMDGFQFKITIVSGKRVKKIYIGNAYEERSDSLTSIFNKYFSQEQWMKTYLESNGAGYWGNREWIDELIRSDKRSRSPLSEEKRRFYLDKFCE